MAVNAHQRNLDDEQLRALAANGGVVGIVFCTPFLDAAARAEEQRLRETAEYKALRGANDTELFLAQCEFCSVRRRRFPLERVLDHLCHAVEVAGIDHVGLGSDYDGIQRTPRWPRGRVDLPTRWPTLLARRGFLGIDERRARSWVATCSESSPRVTAAGDPAPRRRRWFPSRLPVFVSA
jgi:membrane dipeptidase